MPDVAALALTHAQVVYLRPEELLASDRVDLLLVPLLLHLLHQLAVLHLQEFPLPGLEVALVPHQLAGDLAQGRPEGIFVLVLALLVAGLGVELGPFGCEFLADEVHLRLEGAVVDLVQVLPVYFLLPLQLGLPALFDQVLLHRQVSPPPLGNHTADLVNLRPVRQIGVLQLLLLLPRLLLYYVQVALLYVRLVVQAARHVFVYAAQLLPRQAALQGVVQRLYFLLLHDLDVDGLVVFALFG